MKKIYFILFFILNFEYCYAENKIAYIDISHILNNSLVGQSISQHIKKIEEKKNNDFITIEKKLMDKENDLLKKKNIIEKNEFEEQVRILKIEINDYKNEKKKFNDDIDKEKLKYTKIVLKNLNPIISKYVEEHSISMVFPKKNIIIAKKNLDITNTIMELLNIQLNKIDF